MISMTPGHLPACFERRHEEGEPLILKARAIMAQSGFRPDQLDILDKDPSLQRAMGVGDNTQRHYLNSFLNVQYLSIPKDTSYERSMIASGAPMDLWLQIFAEFHVPSMKALDLPHSIH